MILLGEDVPIYGDHKLTERFGKNRVWNVPISEGSSTGLEIGAAINGLRPVTSPVPASSTWLRKL
ncbi:hypothetical protein NKI70_27405 [Mesorhizobium sp. M0500]